MSDTDCLICGARALHPVAGYWELFRVTSDCRPWRQGGTLLACGACGVAQKLMDERWRQEANEIYSSYSLYPQAEGAEQAVFGDAGRIPEPRSRRLLGHMLREVPLPDEGRLLDVGCGNGAMLRSFHELRPRWRLEGAELDERYRAAIEGLPGVTRFHTGSPDRIQGRFDLVTLLHVLEHVGSPRGCLEALLEKIEPSGRLFIQCPDVARNPFDLIISDHTVHFTRTALEALIETAGYEIQCSADNWVAKEISIVARPSPGRPCPRKLEHLGSIRDIERALRWLKAVRSHAGSLATPRQIGIFGTSVAGSWLWAELRSAVGYFVDEDPNRIGRSYLGCPVLAPGEVPAGGLVYVVLTPAIAREVSARCIRPGVTYVVPPELDEPGRTPQQSAR